VFERWIGETDGNFRTGGNWSGGVAPDPSTSLLLGTGASAVLMTTTDPLEVRGLSLEGGSALHLQAASELDVDTALSNAGTLTLEQGTVLGGGGILSNTGVLTTAGSASIAIELLNQGRIGIAGSGTLALSTVDNLADGVLAGGRWQAAGGGTIDLGGGAVTELGRGTAVTLAGAGTLTAGGQDIAATLSQIDAGATLVAGDGHELAFAGNVRVDGAITLAGGTLGGGENGDFHTVRFTTGSHLSGDGTINAVLFGNPGASLTVGRGDALTFGHNNSDFNIWSGTIDGKGTLAIADYLELGSGAQVTVAKLVNSGTLDTDTASVSSTLVNNGRVLVGTLQQQGAVSGAGTFSLDDGGSTVAFGAKVAATQTIAMASQGAGLTLDDANHFKALIAGFGSRDDQSIDLSGFHDDSLKLRWTEDADGEGGVLHVKDGVSSASLHFEGSYTAASFEHGVDAAGTGAILTFHTDAVASGSMLHI